MRDPHKAEVSYLDNKEISNLDDAKVRGPNDREVDDFTILTAATHERQLHDQEFKDSRYHNVKICPLNHIIFLFFL